MREWLVVACDGGARGNPGPAAIGAVVFDASDPALPLAAVSERIGVTTNNVAEYRAVIAGLEAAREFPSRGVRVRSDSMLVIRQLEGVWRVKQPHLRPLHASASALLGEWERVELEHVPRALNADADALVNAALDAPAVSDAGS
ncbi:MAG: ribonuclease HI family protein [Actinobacteria bacterium]|nr:MAG: ribonuclease HI family protein [Actinomycetota bacterium]TML63846.1 MAG: ribonuclease HI family protein [Actinomycetota bacterium]